MFNLFLAFFLAFSCPKHADNANNHGTTITVLDDTGGEGGHVPPGITPPTP
ncbi:MAG: hypothetical protein JWR38_5310 [Mucilaginibacter sp.]|nr:hypothetical protein [Mucilaginibacter sp.]